MGEGWKFDRFENGPHDLARGDIFTITTDNGNGTFNAKTNRGARYILRMDQIANMIQL